MAQLISTNPAKNYEFCGDVTISTDSEISNKVQLAQNAKQSWAELGTKKRIAILKEK